MAGQEFTQLLSEHQSYREIEEKVSGYQPTDEEKRAIKLVDHLLSKSKNSRKPYDESWLEFYRIFKGKQWKDARPSFRHSEVINLVFRAIQSEIPILTDLMPKPEFLAVEPQDIELAGILNELMDSDWTANNWSYQLTEILYDSHIYGTGFGCLKWDEEKDFGAGGIVFESQDPFYQFPDPSAMDVNEKCNYYLMAEPRPIEELKKEFPEIAQYIKADIDDIVRREKEQDEQIRYRSPGDNRTIVEGGSSYNIESRDQALKVTAYIKDDTIIDEEIKGMDDAGNEKISYIKKLKYPMGRKIITINGVLAFDGPLEYDDGKFPYIKLVNYLMPREFWGMSEVEQLVSPQRIFNKLVSFTLDVLTLMGNPIWVVDTSSGVDTENLFNRPGLIVEKEPGSEVRREEGVQLQPYVLQMIDRMKIWFDDIAGNPEASRGLAAGGVTAASAIEALQTAANTRLRQKAKNLDAFIQNFGQMYISRVFQYYNSPRVFRITNNQNVTKYFKFHVESSVDDSGKDIKIARIREYSKGEDGKYYLNLEEKQMNIGRKFDVKVNTGSVLPFEKARIETQTMQLFDRQIIDAEEVLKNIKYPNAESVIKRMQEKAMAAAQAAQQEQASVASGSQ